MAKTFMDITNDTGFTDRSVRACFNWSWKKIRPLLTPGQRTNVGIEDGLHVGIAVGRPLLLHKNRLRVDPNDACCAILALYFWRAGLKGWWNRAQDIDCSDAPKLAKPAPRKKREPPPFPYGAVNAEEAVLAARDRDRATAERRCGKLLSREYELKRQLAKLQKDIKSNRASKTKAARWLRLCERSVKLAQQHVDEAPAGDTSELTPKTYADRMRAKRERQSAAPTTR